ncbi:MAG TPA: NAD-dependent epimerase/dehydratase family protein [Alcanivoracaceae bacterium]|nr:NAD-dependent epimerase/dehydratase family protein [Alcanivoracaceae bacterium]
MAHVLMVGLGQLGSPLSEKLLALGHQVSAIRRGSEAPAGVHLLQQDLLRVPVVQLPSEPVDLIYIIVTPAARNALAYEEAFITLPQRVLSAVAAQQPKIPPVIFVSSTAVYGDGAQVVDEDSPTDATTFNGQALIRAEQQIQQMAPATVVRFSGIYGPTRRGRVALAKRLLTHPQEAPVARWSSRIHSDDVVGLLLHLGQRWLAHDAPPAVVVGSDQEPVVNVELLNWLAEQQGEHLGLAWQQAQGRPVRSRYIEEGHYLLQYPSFREGYSLS